MCFKINMSLNNDQIQEIKELLSKKIEGKLVKYVREFSL